MNSNKPTHEEISARAYQIFVERGCPEGCDLEHWLEAEAQLNAQGQRQQNAEPGVSATSTGSTGAQKTSARTSAPRKSTGKAPTAARL